MNRGKNVSYKRGSIYRFCYISILSLVVLIITSCSQPRIDVTSDETFKSSVQEVQKSLPEDKRDEFDKALRTIMVSQIKLGELFESAMTDKDASTTSPEDEFKNVLSNKTGQEVIGIAKKIRIERKKRKELRKKQAESSKDD